MASLEAVGQRSDWRARRWDAVVLGSGVASLVAAARLGMAGHRVLVVEEEAAARMHPALREPFCLSGARNGGILDGCMRALTLPLIDRRRLVPQPIAYQVVGPDSRVDVGEAELSASEWVAWGLAKPEEARDMAAALVESASVELASLMESPAVRIGGSLGRALGLAGAPQRRDPARATPPPLPETPAWRCVFEAQLRALSHWAHASPPAEARGRLLGDPLSGGAGFRDSPPWLWGLLRRRVQSVYGEFRTLPGGFRMVTADGLPGLALPDSKEVWLGRSLVVGAPTSALARVLDPGDRPDFVREAPSLRRHRIHLRVKRELLSEGMADRVVLVGDPTQPLEGANLLTIGAFRDPDEPAWTDLVVSMLVDPDADPDPVDEAARARLRELLPFMDRDGDRGLARRPVPIPSWDDDGWLEDPIGSAPAGSPVDLRVSGRPPVYRLDRASLGAFGLEGDLLLGWRGGDAIAEELA